MADSKSESVKYAPVNHQNIPGRLLRLDGRIKGIKRLRAPAVIFSTLLVGLAVALAHHFMNVHLDKKPIENVSVSQAWISRISTGLAFLAKLLFTISVGASFTQRLWLRFHQQNFKISEVDAVISVLGDFLSFFSSLVWLRHPVLVLMALTSWIIPFAAVVTPGSLSVLPLRTPASKMLQVPQPRYDSTYFGYTADTGSGRIMANDRLYQLAYATASTAQPLSLLSAYQNETYHIQFNGPAVKCRKANESLILSVSKEYGVKDGYYPYRSWVPGDEGTGDAQHAPSNTLDENWSQKGEPRKNGATIYIMSNTAPSDIIVDATSGMTKVNVTECELYNATYDVDYTFQFPQQTSYVNISAWQNPIWAPNIHNLQYVVGGISSTYAYCMMMKAFGKLLVGQEAHMFNGVQFTYGTSWKILNINWNRSEAVEAGLEQLFQNFTLSLLSDESFIQNSTIARYVPVTVESWPVTYIYNRFDLLLPYGLSFLAACICAVIGLHAFIINRDSYQNLFSTFLRVTNNPEIRAVIGQGDSGADPLPKRLAQLSIRVVGEKRSE